MIAKIITLVTSPRFPRNPKNLPPDSLIEPSGHSNAFLRNPQSVSESLSVRLLFLEESDLCRFPEVL